jgi:hypothetical protein
VTRWPERLYRKVAFLALVTLVSPACGGGKNASAPPLLSDDFSVFPGTNWTTPTITGSATAAMDTGVGAPPPSLKMTTTAATATASTTTTSGFNNPSVTFSVQIADVSSATTQVGTATITILDATPSAIATASWDNTTGIITFHINGGVDVQSAVIPADGTFHRVEFSVSSGGIASWSLDGAAALINHAVAGGMLKLQLGASFGAGTAWPSFYFDNMVVTAP